MLPKLCQIQIALVKVLCNKKGLLAPVIPESVACGRKAEGRNLDFLY